MKHSGIIFVSFVITIMALVCGLILGAQIASNSVEAWEDSNYIYVQILGETQVHYKS